MTRLDIGELMAAFPTYRVAVLVAAVAMAPTRPAALDRLVGETERAVGAAIDGKAMSELPAIAAWRRAYKAFGIKSTSYRCSVERLLRSIQQGRGLPRINPLVDAYNVVSARHCLPVGADDLDRVEGDLAFRFSRPGDSYIRLGDAEGAEDPPKPGEVVYADAEKVLCRRWNWAQDARSAITPQTRRAVITIQSLLAEDHVAQAAEDLLTLIAAHTAGRAAFTIASADTPTVTLPTP